MNSDWIPLGDLLNDIRNGLDAEQYDQPIHEDMLPISRIETISEGAVDFSRVKYAKVTEAELRKYQLRKGDILFSHINSPQHIGKTAIFRDDRTLIHGINLLLFRPNVKRCHPQYLNYYLKSYEVRARFRTRCKKAVNQASLNQSDILSLEVPLPSVSDQMRIAGILEKADRLRRIRRYTQRLSESYLKSVFLKKFDNYLKESNAKQTIGDLVTITGGGTPSREIKSYYEGIIPWLTAKDMRGDYIFDTQEHITEEAIKKSATKLIPAGSILLVVKSKVLMHRLPIALAMRPMCHGQDIKSVQCSEKINSLFLLYLFKYYEPKLLFQARGANTEGLTLPMLENLPMPDIPLTLQEDFGRIVLKFDRIRKQQREAKRQAEHLFQTLLHRAFRGEL